jgi:hypothetical protein
MEQKSLEILYSLHPNLDVLLSFLELPKLHVHFLVKVLTSISYIPLTFKKKKKIKQDFLLKMVPLLI